MSPSIVLQKLEDLSTNDRSKFSSNDIEHLKEIIKRYDSQFKGKTFLWNEKGFVAEIPLVEKKVNNNQVELNLDALTGISNYFLVNGKMDAESIIIQLFLENISSVEDILSNNSVKMAFACALQSRNKTKMLTAIVFSTRTK